MINNTVTRNWKLFLFIGSKIFVFLFHVSPTWAGDILLSPTTLLGGSTVKQRVAAIFSDLSCINRKIKPV